VAQANASNPFAEAGGRKSHAVSLATVGQAYALTRSAGLESLVKNVTTATIAVL